MPPKSEFVKVLIIERKIRKWSRGRYPPSLQESDARHLQASKGPGHDTLQASKVPKVLFLEELLDAGSLSFLEYNT